MTYDDLAWDWTVQKLMDYLAKVKKGRGRGFKWNEVNMHKATLKSVARKARPEECPPHSVQQGPGTAL